MNDAVMNDNLPDHQRKGSHPTVVELRVWWIPQVPMKPFSYPVPDVAAAKLLVDALARYDLFQFENGIKPDYCNTGGTEWRHRDLPGGEWLEFDPEDGSECEEIEVAVAKSACQGTARQVL
jgi:hypothetical protein